MSKLSNLKTSKIIKVCIKLGWRHARTKGRHMSFVKNGKPRPIVLLNKETTPEYIVRQIIQHLKVSKERFVDLIRNI